MSRKSLVKKPLSAYLRFMKFRMQELQSLIGLADQTIKELSQEEWDLMTPAEKLPFYEIANNEKLKFELKKDYTGKIWTCLWVVGLRHSNQVAVYL